MFISLIHNNIIRIIVRQKRLLKGIVLSCKILQCRKADAKLSCFTFYSVSATASFVCNYTFNTKSYLSSFFVVVYRNVRTGCM